MPSTSWWWISGAVTTSRTLQRLTKELTKHSSIKFKGATRKTHIITKSTLLTLFKAYSCMSTSAILLRRLKWHHLNFSVSTFLQQHTTSTTRKFFFNNRGVNNFFEIKRKTKLAILYNDQSVLENHHAAFFFGLTMQPEMNVLKEYDWKEYSDCRKFIIDIILHTDMAKHFSY